jgi:DNA-binding SARP family transcriptional activator/TolB-like protein/Tfp pilus assembly protein PilF
MFRVRLLAGASIQGTSGPLSGGVLQRHRVAVLALLATAPQRTLSRDKLIAYLWPESDVGRARHLLRSAVHAIRQALGENAILSSGDDLRLNPELIGTDVGEFLDRYERDDLEGALALYAGPFLDGFHLNDAPELDRWIEGEREQLERLRRTSMQKLAERAEQRGDRVVAVEWWRKLAAADPYNSRVALALMRAEEAAGDRAAAIRHARVHEQLLRAELGAEPDPDVTAFAEQLRTAPVARVEPIVAVTRPPAGLKKSSTTHPPAPHLPAAPVAAPVPRRHWPALALVLIIVLGIAAVLSTKLLGGKAVAVSGDRSIAVLPFADLSPGRDHQYLSDGIADELISALSKAGTLRVAARTSSFALRKREMSVPEIGRTLNVATVLEGSVLRERDRLRINVQLVDAARGYTLWSKTYDQPVNDDGAVIDDMFRVQADIAAHVIDRLDLQLPEATRRRVSAAPADNREAYTLYLKGRYFWNKRNEQDIQRALDYYHQAVDLDPGYALAWVGIADSYIFRGWYAQLAPDETFPKAKHAALRALEFDSTLAEAHASLAHIHFEYDHDWPAAEREYLRAIQLRPTYSVAHHWYGGFLTGMERHAQALAQADTALALDPLAPIIQTWRGLRFYFARNYDDAVKEFRKATELDHSFAPAYWHRSWAYLQLGRGPEAVAEAKRACDLDKENLLYVAALGHAYASTGMKREAQAIVTRLAEASKARYVSAYEIALIHLALGDRDQALTTLERAYADQSVMIGYLRVDPRVDALRGDPRFKRLLQQAALDF